MDDCKCHVQINQVTEQPCSRRRMWHAVAKPYCYDYKKCGAVLSKDQISDTLSLAGGEEMRACLFAKFAATRYLSEKDWKTGHFPVAAR